MLSQLPLLAFAGLALAAPANTNTKCTLFNITVNGTAQNRNLTGINLGDPAILSIITADAFQRITVSGPQTLAVQYCPPQVKNNNNNKLEILFHGITSNKAYWDAFGGSLGFAEYKPQLYSYVDFATSLGYPTLAVDRLGAGASSKPDGTLVVQGPYEYALYHDLVQQVKAGKVKQLGRAYTDLVYVGHSYGSEIGASMAQLYPTDFNNFVLTGFTNSVQPSLPGVSLQMPVPAAQHDPARFGGLPPDYLTSSNQQARINSFFGTRSGIDYDAAWNNIFYDREDIVTVGQFVTVYLGNSPATAYKGRAFALTGGKDQAFCGPGSPVLGPADCTKLLPATKNIFPNAQYSYYNVRNTGHAADIHYTSLQVYTLAHQFIAGQTFAVAQPS